jgi:hypothetical protein
MGPMAFRRRSLFDAWVAAASGPGGFWRSSAPAAHFRTASMVGPELAGALLALLDRRPEITRVVEVGSGDGALLASLHQRRPALALAGSDLRPRPAGLPPAVGWAQDLWDVRSHRWTTGAFEGLLAAGSGPMLLLAVEWLDDLPCRVAKRTSGVWYELDDGLVPTEPLGGEEQGWIATWWPDGERVEVGSTRDRAWGWLVRSLAPIGGQVLMVDYGHERAARPGQGSLAAYQGGRRVPPVALPDRNLTAHVAVDAVAAAGERAGARTVSRSRQAEALAALLAPPAPSADVLGALAARSRRAALAAPRGWGGHWWLLQDVPPPPPRPDLSASAAAPAAIGADRSGAVAT